MATNMKENGFETMIVKYLVENNHYEEGSNSDYNKIYAIDEVRLFRFLHDTQDEKLAELRIEDNEIEKKKFLDRLSKKISDDGVINIIRKGMKYKNKTVDFYMVRPSEGNQEAKESYDKNIFSVTRQLRYSNDYGRLALDVCIFLNGLPIITMELKNQITKQNHDDAIRQYMTDRTPDELLFQFKRCIVHFAVDDDEIYMCTELKKEKSFFMPFNKGNNNGAGNPRNPNGLKTDYLWKDILTKPCLSNILENYVQITEEKDEDTGRKSYKQIFPRYHQLDVVRKLIADVREEGSGHNYLIQHSAGSGKSNSISWLAHHLSNLHDKNDKVVGLWVQPQMISKIKGGRPSPKTAAKDEVLIPCDLIVVAIGQGIETRYFEEHGVTVKRGTIEALATSEIKEHKGIFAGGDCVTGPATVIRAIAAGKVAAANIDDYLGFHHEITCDVEIPYAGYEDKIPCGRVEVAVRDAADRKKDFEPIEYGFSCEEACQESGRCLRCDHFGFGSFRGGREEQW